jgi:hypothetical protein
MSDNSDHSYIIYQGHAEKWRWRKVDAKGDTVRDEQGEQIHSEIFFRNAEQARIDLLSIDPEAQIEEKRAANFDETIDDAEERDEQEAEA